MTATERASIRVRRLVEVRAQLVRELWAWPQKMKRPSLEDRQRSVDLCLQNAMSYGHLLDAHQSGDPSPATIVPGGRFFQGGISRGDPRCSVSFDLRSTALGENNSLSQLMQVNEPAPCGGFDAILVRLSRA